MRRVLKVILIIIATIGFLEGQEFYKSKGLELFNQGRYRAAIDSMMKWADRYTSERGITYYYIGESYYNLGLDSRRQQEAVDYFKKSAEFFRNAEKQSDIISRYPDKLKETKYKQGWCFFRLAELERDPIQSLNKAVAVFSELASSGRDTLSIFSLYMKGEAYYRLNRWKQMVMSMSLNPGEKLTAAKQIVDYLQNSENAFLGVVRSRNINKYLRYCARLRYQDIFVEYGRLYDQMDQELIGQITDPRKKGDPLQTARFYFQEANYWSVYSSMDVEGKRILRPIVIYSDLFKNLNLFLITGDDNERQRFNSVLDSLESFQFQNDRYLFMGFRDNRSGVDEDVYYRLIDPNTSSYIKAAKSFPEALYWLGWAQFIANRSESETNFKKFLENTSSITNDPRIRFLREDARYRLLLLRFDEYANDKRVLRQLKSQIERFNPENAYIKDQTDLLYQLVRVGLGESIWGSILGAQNSEEKFKNAFTLIQNMMVRATKVTGKKRVPYLEYLNRLFRITEDRKREETTFFKGLTEFLRAEIQETDKNKRRYYFSSAKLLSSVRGVYKNEADYVRARSYFAAAKHESNEKQRTRVLRMAKPIFINLINRAHSLRSVYYLGEIFRIEGNDLVARKCYEVVKEKTRNKISGEFWYNNAEAGIQNCGFMGDSTKLSSIRINEVLFPESLLVMNGEVISLEKFADPAFVRRQYWERALNLILEFGMTKRSIYPTDTRPFNSRFWQRSFGNVSAKIWERRGAITSGLELVVLFPDGVDRDVEVRFNGLTITKSRDGIYQKIPIMMNQVAEIRVESPQFYPYIKTKRFTRPGVERIVIPLLFRKMFLSKGFGVDKDIRVAYFTRRLDKSIIVYPATYPFSATTYLYKDFQSNLNYRDFAYSAVMDAFLVVHGDPKSLLVYSNDNMISKEGVLNLIVPEGVDTLKSPEGVAVDSKGNIFITDWDSHRIFVFRSDGSFVRVFGSFGYNRRGESGRPVHLMFPTSIAIAEDREGVLIEGKRVFRDPYIFVADRNGVHILDVEGHYWDTIEPQGMEKGTLYSIEVAGYDENQRLYIVNRKSGQIQRFSTGSIKR